VEQYIIFQNETESDISGLDVMNRDADVSTRTSQSIDLSGTTTDISFSNFFITPLNDPGAVAINAGFWLFNIWADLSNSLSVGEEAYIYAKIYNTDASGGNQSLIADNSANPISIDSSNIKCLYLG